MTPQEFTGWWSDLKTRFPSVRKWIATHAPQSDAQQAVLKTWREVMADAPHAEAMTVNAKMQAGDLPWLGDYEPIDRLPQHVRKLARQMAWESGDLARTSDLAASTSTPRYHCHLCLDHGVIEIASPSAIRCILKGEDFSKCWHKSGVVRCRCNNRENPALQYEPTLDFKIEDFLWRPAEVERLRAWVEHQREHGAQARAKANPNYNPALAEWSR